MVQKLKNNSIKTSKSTILFIYASTLALLAIVFLTIYLISKPRYQEVSFYFETIMGDQYNVDAYLEKGRIKKTEVTIIYYGKTETEKEKKAYYNYEIMKNQDKYENLTLEGKILKYKSFDNQFKNKTKEEIEKEYSKSNLYNNFSWKEK